MVKASCVGGEGNQKVKNIFNPVKGMYSTKNKIKNLVFALTKIQTHSLLRSIKRKRFLCPQCWNHQDFTLQRTHKYLVVKKLAQNTNFNAIC